MKKFLSILALVMSLVMCVSMFAACGDKDGADTTAASTEDANKVTVTWYNGTKELKTEKVEKGSKVTNWTPEAGEGETFDGWFAEASKTTAFDFDKAITENTDIFAKFSSNVYVEDTNAYYAIGGGSGTLKDVSWDHAKGAEKTPFVKADDKTANIYTLTMTLYAGDQFQICYGGAWDGQTGIGFIKGAEYCDGINSYDKTEYKAADKKVAQVKDAEGNVVFVGSDEFNKGFETWNITLAEGMDGEYKFTFTTYPNAKEKNQITFELVKKLEAQAETHKMHLVGTFNEWNPADTNDAYKMTAAQDGKTWSAFLTITEKTEFKVVNQIGTQWFSTNEGNIVLEEAGTYAVKYTVEGDKVEVAKCEYYVVGTFADAEGKAVNFAVKDGVTPKLTVDGKKASVKFTATDVTGMGDYSWMKDQGKPGVFAFQVVLGCELGIKDWYKDTAADDNFYVAAGEVTVELDLSGETPVASIAK